MNNLHLISKFLNAQFLNNLIEGSTVFHSFLEGKFVGVFQMKNNFINLSYTFFSFYIFSVALSTTWMLMTCRSSSFSQTSLLTSRSTQSSAYYAFPT